jgi:hypothetical protein
MLYYRISDDEMDSKFPEENDFPGDIAEYSVTRLITAVGPHRVLPATWCPGVSEVHDLELCFDSCQYVRKLHQRMTPGLVPGSLLSE